MAKLLFRLNGVTDEEADDVRQLLDDHDLEYYETSAGRWGFSVAAIWLVDNDDFPAARDLLDDYQAERRERVRGDYDRAQKEGRAETLWQRWREDPVTLILVLIGLGVVIGLSTIPFFKFVGWA